MARVEFAKAFQRHVDGPADDVPGATVGEVLGAYFERHPGVRGYVLDDQDAVRKHVTVFLNDEQIADRRGLSDVTGPDDKIHVFQALSGG
jgi:hypothetical protein